MLYGFFSWEGIARLIRLEALQRTGEQYIQVAEAAGASQAWGIRRHIIPNVSNTVIAGLVLFGLVLAFDYVGDAMWDAPDPRNSALCFIRTTAS